MPRKARSPVRSALGWLIGEVQTWSQAPPFARFDGVIPGGDYDLALSLGDLAYLMIAISDNTASNLVIDARAPAVVDFRVLYGSKWYSLTNNPARFEDTITTMGNVTGWGRKFVRTAQGASAGIRSGGYWWSKPWIGELFPDDLFTELVGPLNRVPQRQWPHVLATAVALRRSWRRDGLAQVARRLRVSLAARDITSGQPRTPHHSRPSPSRFSGSPRPRQGSPLRFDPARRGLRP